MNIVNFTPMPAFVGGVIIGLAVVVLYIGNGRLASISSIGTISLLQNKTKEIIFYFLLA